MRLKAFSAPTMALAMAQVRAELGNDAIIVSTRNGGTENGVTVTAAVDGLPLAAAANGNDGGSAHPDPWWNDPHDAVDTILDFHRVPPAVADPLRATTASLDADNPVALLAGALDYHFSFRPIAPSPGTAVVLMGPPGSGKTVAAAKIAANALLAGRPVRLVNADTGRAGGEARLKALAERIQLPLEEAPDRDALADRLRHAASEVVVVDTPGMNPLDQGEFDELRRLLAGVGALRVLVLAAGTDALDAADQATAFTALGAQALIATRLDAAQRYGGLLAAAHAAKLPFAASGICPQIGEGLSPLNPMSLARLLATRTDGSRTANPSRELAS